MSMEFTENGAGGAEISAAMQLVMRALDKQPKQSVRDLRRATGLSRQSLDMITKQLETGNYVTGDGITGREIFRLTRYGRSILGQMQIVIPSIPERNPLKDIAHIVKPKANTPNG